MPNRGEQFAEGNYYHVYNRGAGRNLLFFGQDNYEYCLRLVKRYHERYGITVVAYCLMPNHYHFLLRLDAGQRLSQFINVLFNAYVQAANRQQNRSGTLFEGRFRHVRVDREEYLLQLCRYIHLNPVNARLVSCPDDWLYSNYLECVGKRAGTLKDQNLIRAYFASPEEYAKFVNDGRDEIRTAERIQRYVWD